MGEPDFYEDDEPVTAVVAAFDAGDKHLTSAPSRLNRYVDVPGVPPATWTQPTTYSNPVVPLG